MHPNLRFLAGILDFLIPSSCPLCEDALPSFGGRTVCAPCMEKLERTSPPWCPRCGKPFLSQMTLAYSPDHLCADCREHPPAYDRARALGPMEGGLRDLIHLFKFEGKSGLADALAPALGGLARAEFPETAGDGSALVTYVPIHLARWRERGFDQAQILARRTAAWLDLPFEKTLERKRETPPQTGLPAARRRSNLRGAFGVIAAGRIAGKRTLLRDDVLTTGSTASACARALKGAGALSVEVLTVCHVPFRGAGMRPVR